MEITCPQESSETLLKKFGETVEYEYSRQNSTPTPPKWSEIHSLITLLKRIEKIAIAGMNKQKMFIQDLLKYIDLVMDFLSSYGETEYRKQRNYAHKCLSQIPDIFAEVNFKNVFVQEATGKILDLFLYGKCNLLSKKWLMHLYNTIASGSNKSIRIEVANSMIYCMYKLLDCLPMYGDYEMQSDVMETLFRLFGDRIKHNEGTAYDLLPGCKDLGKALVSDISVNQFDADVRIWLNRFNQDSLYIFSVGCRKVLFGNYVCPTPEEFSKVWVDFNLKEFMVSFYSQGPIGWNLITILANDVKRTEVKRPLGTDECTVSFYMVKSCISHDRTFQSQYNMLDKHLKLVIGNEEKENITKLITTVLPHVFKDSFSHTSDKISSKSRNVYKPLPIKVSKRKSCASDISIATTVSRSKSDAASEERVEISSATTQAVSLLGCSDITASVSRSKSDSEERVTKSKYTKPPVSMPVYSDSITDCTRLSCLCDPTADFISEDNSDAFSSSRLTSPVDAQQKEQQPKVQDNIVTSSHEEDDQMSSRIKILSGRCSGRSKNYQKSHDATDFRASEVFSSSPVKISKPKDSEDISRGFFTPSEDSERQDDRRISVTSEMKNLNISALMSEEARLEEEFETALETFEKEETVVVKNKISSLRKAEETLSKVTYKKRKKSKLMREVERIEMDDEREKPNLTYEKNEKDLATLEADIDNDKEGWKASRLRIVTPKECERVQERQMKDSSDSDEAELIDSQKYSDSNEDKVPELGNKNVVLISSENNEFFTEDLYEDNQKIEKVVEPQEVLREDDSEYFFGRPAQIVRTQNSADSHFTDSSLVVNVGISDKQFSEDVGNVIKEIVKPEERAKKVNDLNMTHSQNIEKEKTNSCRSKGTLMEENKENMVDLTLSDTDNESAKAEKVRKGQQNKKKNKKVVDEEKPSLETLKLVVILDKEIDPRTAKTETDDKQQLIADNNSTKDPLVEKPKTRKRKKPLLLKTGKKRFALENVEGETQNIADALTRNENDQVKVKKTDVYISDKEIIQQKNSLDKTSKKQDIIEETCGTGGTSEKQDSGENNCEKLISNEQTVANEPHGEEIIQRIPQSFEECVATEEKLSQAVGIQETSNENIMGENYKGHVFDHEEMEQSNLLKGPLMEKNIIHETVIDRLQQDLEGTSTEIDMKEIHDRGVYVEDVHQTSDLKGASTKNTVIPEYPQEIVSELEQEGFKANNIQENLQEQFDKPMEQYEEIVEEVAQGNQNNHDFENAIPSMVDTQIVEPAKSSDSDNNDEVSSIDKKKRKGRSRKKPKQKKSKEVKDSIDQPEPSISPDEGVLNTVMRTKTPDTSPECARSSKQIISVAEVHYPQEPSIQATTDKEVRKLNEPIKKVGSSEDSLSQEIRKIEEDIVGTYKNEIGNKKRQFQALDETVEPFSAFKRTRSQEKLGGKSPDDFDKLLAETTANKSMINTTVGSRRRKLYNPGSFTHLDQLPVRKLNEPIKKVGSSEDSLSQEIRKIEEDIVGTYKNEIGNKKRQFQALDETVEPFSTFKRTRSQEKLGGKSPDDFDKLLAETTANKSMINTTVGSRRRKLYNPGSFTHLDQLPGVTEQASSEWDETPIPVTKGTRLTKRKEAELLKSKDKSNKKAKTSMKETNVKSKRSPKETRAQERPKPPRKSDITEQNVPEFDEVSIPVTEGTKLTTRKQAELLKSKEKSCKKSKTSLEDSKKSPIGRKALDKFKPARKSGKRKEFCFSTASYKDFEELFNKTCRGLGQDSFSQGYSALHPPMDIAVRSAPQYISSDESPEELGPPPKKNISPKLPRTVKQPTTPPTSAYSFPGLEIEQLHQKVQVPQKKIKILQDIVLKPPERTVGDGPFVINTGANINQSPEGKKNNDGDTKEKTEDKSLFLGLIKLFKFVITLIERRNHSDSLRKLRELMEITEDY